MLHTLLTLSLIPLSRKLEPLFQALNLSELAVFLLLLCGVYLAKNTSFFLQEYSLSQLVLRALFRYRQDVFLERTEQSPLNVSAGKETSLLLSDLQWLQKAWEAFLIKICPNAVLLLFLLGYLLYLNAPLIVLGGLLFPLNSWVLVVLGQRVQRESKAIQVLNQKLYTFVQESFLYLTTLRALEGLHTRGQDFALLQEDFKRRYQKLWLWRYLQPALVGFLQVLSIAVLLFFAAWQFQSGYLTWPDFLAFATALALAIDPVLHFSEGMSAWQEARGVQSQWEAVSPVSPPQRKTELSLHEVCFTPVFPTPLNCTFATSSYWGIMGSSGVGKSTLLALLAGQIEPDTGEVFWPEQGEIVFLPQQAALFSGTLRYNLCLSRLVPDEHLLSILKHVCLGEWFRSLDAGLDTLLGGEQRALSGGELQRLAIARALLRAPAFLLLDEATSEIDIETEALIFSALKQYYPEMSLICVSHRQSTYTYVDRVLALEAGQITEIGGDSLWTEQILNP